MRLTVFVGVKGAGTRVSGREEEEARVNSYARSNQRNELKGVELTSQVRLLLFSEDDEEKEQNEDNECLDPSPSRPEEDSDEDHGHFPQHYHTLPVVGALLVALEEEGVSLSYFLILKSVLPFP